MFSFNMLNKYQLIPSIRCHNTWLDVTQLLHLGQGHPSPTPLVGSPAVLQATREEGTGPCPAQLMISLQSPSDSLREA